MMILGIQENRKNKKWQLNIKGEKFSMGLGRPRRRMRVSSGASCLVPRLKHLRQKEEIMSSLTIVPWIKGSKTGNQILNPLNRKNVHLNWRAVQFKRKKSHPAIKTRKVKIRIRMLSNSKITSDKKTSTTVTNIKTCILMSSMMMTSARHQLIYQIHLYSRT